MTLALEKPRSSAPGRYYYACEAGNETVPITTDSVNGSKVKIILAVKKESLSDYLQGIVSKKYNSRNHWCEFFAVRVFYKETCKEMYGIKQGIVIDSYKPLQIIDI